MSSKALQYANGESSSPRSLLLSEHLHGDYVLIDTPAADFVSFLNASPTPYHAVDTIKSLLLKNGFSELSERVSWAGKFAKGGKYFVTRNGSSIIAFTVGQKWQAGNGLSIVGAHTDSPTLRIKPVSKRSAEGFIQIGVETYGGGIWHSWFDSDLSLAGRIIVKQNDGRFAAKLININKPILKIPTLAIHLDRDVNTKFEFNKETQLLPIAGLNNAAPNNSGKDEKNEKNEKNDNIGGCCSDEDSKLTKEEFKSLNSVVQRHNEQLVELIAKQAEVSVDQIEDFELVLYDNKPATIGGLNDEFIFSARLDNLTSCYTSVEGLIQAASEESLKEESGIRLVSLFDHEEIGSASAQGADSNFLPNILDRITGLNGDESDNVQTAIQSRILESSAKSFFLSSDVAHGVHPNYSNKYESNHKPNLGEGPVIKINANQRYVTNSPGIVLLKEVAKIAKVPLQLFVVQNASPCGSTIGPITASKTGIRTLDLGNGVLSMHSIRETSSSADIETAIKLYRSFYENFSTIEPTIIVDGE
jgi:aspartyl aminopeptidase